MSSKKPCGKPCEVVEQRKYEATPKLRELFGNTPPAERLPDSERLLTDKDWTLAYLGKDWQGTIKLTNHDKLICMAQDAKTASLKDGEIAETKDLIKELNRSYRYGLEQIRTFAGEQIAIKEQEITKLQASHKAENIKSIEAIEEAIKTIKVWHNTPEMVWKCYQVSPEMTKINNILKTLKASVEQAQEHMKNSGV